MSKHFFLLPFVLCLGLSTFAQTNNDIRPLEAGTAIEREIAGGETHTYQVKLATGQFSRVIIEQKGIDLIATLVTPDAKQAIEADLSSGGFGQESLSHEATAAGHHSLV